MIFTPAADIEVAVNEGGELTLFSPAKGVTLWCEGPAVAMWIALRQHSGRVDAAAEALAEVWHEDLVEVRHQLWAWAHRLWSVGLLWADE